MSITSTKKAAKELIAELREALPPERQHLAEQAARVLGNLRREFATLRRKCDGDIRSATHRADEVERVYRRDWSKVVEQANNSADAAQAELRQLKSEAAVLRQQLVSKPDLTSQQLELLEDLLSLLVVVSSLGYSIEELLATSTKSDEPRLFQAKLAIDIMRRLNISTSMIVAALEQDQPMDAPGVLPTMLNQPFIVDAFGHCLGSGTAWLDRGFQR